MWQRGGPHAFVAAKDPAMARDRPARRPTDVIGSKKLATKKAFLIRHKYRIHQKCCQKSRILPFCHSQYGLLLQHFHLISMRSPGFVAKSAESLWLTSLSEVNETKLDKGVQYTVYEGWMPRNQMCWLLFRVLSISRYEGSIKNVFV